MILFPIERTGLTSAPIDGAHAAVEGVIRATVDLYRRKGFRPPWTGYLAVEDGVCVGTCGFAGPPVQGEAEIAYFTFSGHEGQGVATRMARELMALSRKAAGASIVHVAYTLPEQGPSTRVLRKLGFVLMGALDHPEDGEVWKWREADTVWPEETASPS